MDTTALAALQNRFVAQTPLCSAAFATAYIRQAATQFFRESEVWRYTFEDIDIVKNQATYELVFPSGMTSGIDVWRIDYAKAQGTPVTQDTYELDLLDPDGDESYEYYMVYKANHVPSASVTISDYAAWAAGTTYDEDDTVNYDNSYWVSLQGTNLNKNPVTETDWWELAYPEKGLDVHAVLAPTIVDGYVTPLIWAHWSEALLYGAQVRAYSSRNRPWYDPISAGVAVDNYACQLALARREQTQQFAYDGELRMTNPEGWL